MTEQTQSNVADRFSASGSDPLNSAISDIKEDIFTSLVPIIAYVDMLLEKKFGPLSEEQIKNLQYIQAYAKKLHFKTSNLDSFASSS